MFIELIEGVGFELLPSKAIWWRSKSTLIISDLHLGKSGHFRKNGIAIPPLTNADNLWNLSGLLMKYAPQRLLLLGDLFHSDHNHEWDEFIDMLANFPQVKTCLVKGNHDILDHRHFEKSNIVCIDELIEDGIHFTHEPIEEEHLQKGYNLCGHIHPSIRLRGNGRQHLKLPCFWFSNVQGVMPAFGYFTGTHAIRPSKTDRVFVVAEETVLEV